MGMFIQINESTLAESQYHLIHLISSHFIRSSSDHFLELLFDPPLVDSKGLLMVI